MNRLTGSLILLLAAAFPCACSNGVGDDDGIFKPGDPLPDMGSLLNSGALVFDGADDFVHLAAPMGSFGALTVEGWVKPAAAGGVVLGSADVRVETLATGAVQVELRGRCALEGGSLAPGTWSHIAATFDAQTGAASLAVGGVVVAHSAECPWQPIAALASPRIGADSYGSAARFFSGTIDEIRLWRIARTPAEVAASRAKCLRGNEPNLAAYWSFEERHGQSTDDLSEGTAVGRLGTAQNADAADPAWSADTPF